MAMQISKAGDLQLLKQQIKEVKQEVAGLSMSYHELREVETILQRTLTLLAMATGNKDVAKAIEVFQKAITTIRALQLTIHAFQVASGPLGWILAGTSAAMFAFNAYDSIRGS